MDKNKEAAAGGRPKIFLLSLILPAVWIVVGLTFAQFAPNARLGIPGTVLMYILVAVSICWLILRRHNRMPTNRESWMLVVYCSLFAVFLESWGLIAAATWPVDFPNMEVSPDALKYIIGISAILNPILLALAFKVAAPRWLKNSIPKQEDV